MIYFEFFLESILHDFNFLLFFMIPYVLSQGCLFSLSFSFDKNVGFFSCWENEKIKHLNFMLISFSKSKNLYRHCWQVWYRNEKNGVLAFYFA